MGEGQRSQLHYVCPDENRDSNRSARIGGVEVTAWLHGKAREAWDGPPDCCPRMSAESRAAEGLIGALKRRNGRGAKEPQSEWCRTRS